MHRAALALTVFLSGCASSPSSRETCDFVAESSGLGMTPLVLSSSEKSRWLKDVGAPTAGYRLTRWYQGSDNTRLVCLYTNKCKAEAIVYRRNSSGWQKVDPPNAALLCVLVTPDTSPQRTRER
jgi:hypothetical protein